MTIKLHNILLHKILFGIFYFNFYFPFFSSALFILPWRPFIFHEKFIDLTHESFIELLLIDLSDDGVADHEHFDE